ATLLSLPSLTQPLDQTAVAGLDHGAVYQILTFGPQVTSQTVDIPIIDDKVAEPGENFVVYLSQPSANAGLQSPYFAAVNITHNDLIQPTKPPPRPGTLIQLAGRTGTDEPLWLSLGRLQKDEPLWHSLVPAQHLHRLMAARPGFRSGMNLPGLTEMSVRADHGVGDPFAHVAANWFHPTLDP